MGLLIVFAPTRDFIDSEQWSSEHHVPEDSLHHFRDAELSVYRVGSPIDIPRLVAAFALSNPKELSAKDFLAVKESRVNLTGIEVSYKDGNVPDAIVRPWHRELINMSDAAIRYVTYCFGKHGISRRVRLADVKALVVYSHDNGFYEPERLSEGVKQGLNKSLNGSSADFCSKCHHRDDAHVTGNGKPKCVVCDLGGIWML